MCVCVQVCVRVCVMTRSPVGKRVCLGQAEPLNTVFPFPPQKINEGRKPIKTDDGLSVIAAIKWPNYNINRGSVAMKWLYCQK